MQDDLIEKVEIPKDSFDIINDLVPEEPQVPKNVENNVISINYVINYIIWNQNEVNIDKTYTYNIAMNAINDNLSLKIVDKEKIGQNENMQRIITRFAC